MVPVAVFVGAKADAIGRKPIFLAAFGVLAIRGVLYTLSDNPYYLVGVQLLDGIGAGIYGALFPDRRGRPDPRHRPLQRLAGCGRHEPRASAPPSRRRSRA